MRGQLPGTHWEVDFTEIKPGKYGVKYLLVFIDTFSGWVEAFHRCKEDPRRAYTQVWTSLYHSI